MSVPQLAGSSLLLRLTEVMLHDSELIMKRSKVNQTLGPHPIVQFYPVEENTKKNDTTLPPSGRKQQMNIPDRLRKS